MTLRQLHIKIVRGDFADDANIWYEDGDYIVTENVLYPQPERVWVDTVAGYRLRHGL